MTTGRINQVTIRSRTGSSWETPSPPRIVGDAAFCNSVSSLPSWVPVTRERQSSGQRMPSFLCHVLLMDPCTVHAYHSTQKGRRNTRKVRPRRKKSSSSFHCYRWPTAISYNRHLTFPCHAVTNVIVHSFVPRGSFCAQLLVFHHLSCLTLPLCRQRVQGLLAT